jgi:hypothetical protein
MTTMHASPPPVETRPPRLVAWMRAKPRLLLALEICLLLALSLSAPAPLYDFSPQQRVRGPEFSYLMGTGEIARVMLTATGRLPLWNSWFGIGEPLLESGFSYILNPLMFFPVLAGGMIQGAKVAIILHAGLMALGGWALGYSLGLGVIPRLFLGLMLASTGGFVGAIGMGFYQMALSQAYVPFVYAGVIGCLRRAERFWIGLLAVSGALLIFSGTFWYVLPTAIVSALLVLFGVVRVQRRRPFVSLERRALGRVSLGVALLIAVAAIRLLPVVVNFRLWFHSVEDFRMSHTLEETIVRYFDSSYSDRRPSALFYFYTVPLAFTLALIILRGLAHAAWQRIRRDQWTILIPALIAVTIFTIWAMVDTPFVRILYQAVPFLSEWRLLTRMQAAAAVWIVVILAICLDDLRLVFHRLRHNPRQHPFARHLALIALAAITLWSVFTLWDVRQSWLRESGTEPLIVSFRQRLFAERQARPDEFIAFDTWEFYDYTWFYPPLIRMWHGNPDYRPHSLPHTVSNQQTMRWFAPEAIEMHFEFEERLIRTAYELTPEDLGVVDRPRVWRQPMSPPYAFSVPEATIPRSRVDSLHAREVTPARYQYQMDTITLWIASPPAPAYAVVTEVAYPGWQVSVNGEPRPLESVGGLLGVRLAQGEGAEVIFTYRPPSVYAGGVITLIGCLLTAFWLLRVDRLFKHLVSATMV